MREDRTRTKKWREKTQKKQCYEGFRLCHNFYVLQKRLFCRVLTRYVGSGFVPKTGIRDRNPAMASGFKFSKLWDRGSKFQKSLDRGSKFENLGIGAQSFKIMGSGIEIQKILASGIKILKIIESGIKILKILGSGSKFQKSCNQ